jgi:hypothetical protein
VARLVGSDRQVLIVGRETAAMARTLQARGCRTVAVEVGGRQWIPVLDPPDDEAAEGRSGPFEGEEGREDRRSEIVILADLLGRIEDPRAALQVLKEQIRPGGSLIIALTGITHVGDQPALLGDGLLGAESGLFFSYDGILALLEDAGYAIGHLERTEPASIEPDSNGAGRDGADRPSPSENHLLHDCLIVAYPLPVPGLDFLQQQMRELVQQRQNALRDVEELRRYADLADRRSEIIAGREKVLAERITDLRAQLLAAHAQMIERDDEIRKTFGEALHLRNALLVERDSLAQALRSAEARLDIFRRSPFGRVYRAIRRLMSKQGRIAGKDT